MDICNQGDIHFCLSYDFGNLGEGFGCPDIRCGDADDFATGFSELDSLAGGGFDIEGIGGGHRLNPHRSGSSNYDRAYGDFPGFPANGLKERGAVGRRHTQPCLGKDSLHIKKGDIQHKGKKKYHEEHLSTLEKCDWERFTSDFFDSGKHHVPSV